jgi:hypothetical protein
MARKATLIRDSVFRFRQALRIHNKSLQSLPYQSPIGAIGSWIGLVCNVFIIVLQFITALFPIGYRTMSGQQRATSFFQSFMAFPLIGIIFLWYKFFGGTRIKGVAVSKKGFKFDDPRIVWGNGTVAADLTTGVDFTNSWNQGDYQEFARLHPHLVIWEEALWWCPERLRPIIKFFYFPWDRRPESVQADEENTVYFDTRDDLVASVQRDPDRAFQRVHNLQEQYEMLYVQHENLLVQFGQLENIPP